MGYWKCIVGATVLVIFVAGYGALEAKKGDRKMIEQEIMDLMKNLDTLDERSQMALLSKVDEQRNELLGVLLQYLGSSESKNVQAAAIYLIGRHHLSDGVRELVQRIDFEPDKGKTVRGPEKLWERYPAMEALITIGWPSIPATLELLATDANDLRRDLAVKVLRYTSDAEVAKFILERAQGNEGNATRKRNLQDALLRIAKLPK